MKDFQGETAYVFVRGASADDLRALASLPDTADGVHSVIQVIGSYDAVVCLQVDSLEQIQTATQQYLRASTGMLTETSLAMATLRPPGGVTWVAPLSSTALVRVTTAPGLAEDVMRRVASESGVLGIVLVAGSFDILVEIGADTPSELAARLLRLNGTPGVVSTDTASVVSVTTDGSEHPAEK